MAAFEIKVPAGWTVAIDKSRLRQVMGAAGTEVAAAARVMLRTGDRKRASQPGEPPHSITGELARSIRGRPWKDAEGVTIRARCFYALFLTLGAKGGGGDTHDKANMVMTRITRRVR